MKWQLLENILETRKIGRGSRELGRFEKDGGTVAKLKEKDWGYKKIDPWKFNENNNNQSPHSHFYACIQTYRHKTC